MKPDIRRTTVVAAAALVLAAAVVLYACDPATAGWYPRCPSKMLIGWDCPGCGSLRAMHALLHGRIARAWAYNAMVFFALPAMVLFFIADSRRCPAGLRRVMRHPLTAWLLLAAVIAWGVGRNL